MHCTVKYVDGTTRSPPNRNAKVSPTAEHENPRRRLYHTRCGCASILYQLYQPTACSPLALWLFFRPVPVLLVDACYHTRCGYDSNLYQSYQLTACSSLAPRLGVIVLQVVNWCKFHLVQVVQVAGMVEWQWGAPVLDGRVSSTRYRAQRPKNTSPVL